MLILYSAFLDTQSALHSKGGISSSTTSVQHPSGWWDAAIVCQNTPHTPATGGEETEWWSQSVYALTTHQLQVERRQSDEANQCMLSPHTSYRWRGDRVMKPISVCSHHTPATGGEETEWWSQSVYALTTHQLQVERRPSDEANLCMRSPHTSYRWRRDRVMKPISVCSHHTPATGGEEAEWWSQSVYGDDGQRSMGEFVQDAWVTPRLFLKDILGFLMSGPRFNVSSEGWCLLTV